MNPKAVGQIDPALVSLAVPTDELVPHPENYRLGDVGLIAQSLRRFGQVNPILVQASTRHIVAGNHTYAAALALGWNVIAAAVVEMSDEEARAYLVADNRTSDLASNDEAALVSALRKLASTGRFEGTGYVEDDLDEFLAKLPPVDDLPEPAPPKPPEERSTAVGPLQHREIVLVLTADQAESFGRNIKRLQSHYETQGTSATVLAAVAEGVAIADRSPA